MAKGEKNYQELALVIGKKEAGQGAIFLKKSGS
jgi:hypothetical protein